MRFLLTTPWSKLGPGTCSAASEELGRVETKRRRSPPARRPCCGPPQQHVLTFPRLPAIPFRIYCCVHTPTCTCVRKCLPHRGRCITTERQLDTVEEPARRFSQRGLDRSDCGVARNTASDSCTHTHGGGRSWPDGATGSGLIT